MTARATATGRAKKGEARKPAAVGGRKAKSKRRRSGRRWSKGVTENGDALALEPRVFAKRTPRAIALSLRRSAEHSTRRKSGPYRSAMSMLTFYLNRAGRTLPAARKRVLERAKDELRRLYGRD
jgi:hypothetical protein